MPLLGVDENVEIILANRFNIKFNGEVWIQITIFP